MNNALQHLAVCVARLNPDAGEIGPGMLRSLVEQARIALNETGRIKTACQYVSMNWPLTADQVEKIYRQVDDARGVSADPVWLALGATTEAEALERVAILQGIAKVPDDAMVERVAKALWEHSGSDWTWDEAVNSSECKNAVARIGAEARLAVTAVFESEVKS